MKVNRTVLIPVADRTHASVDGRYHGAAIMQVNTVYKKSTSIGLLQHYFELVGSDTSDEHFQRTSEDNGKLYWISNILKENPDGMRPRYPLQIAEVDEEKIAIIKETITIIEDKQKGDSPLVQFSNFKVYEDRETYEFVLTMARIQERGERDLTSPAYQYRIEV